jgi:hypothetical protein
MEFIKEAASVVFIVALVLGLNWLLRRAGITGT